MNVESDAKAVSYEDLQEAYSVLQIENTRLSAEITRLNVAIADLSYGKLESAMPAPPSPPNTVEVDNVLAALTTIESDDSTTMVPNAILALDEGGKTTQAHQLAALATRFSPNKPELHMRWVRHLRGARRMGQRARGASYNPGHHCDVAMRPITIVPDTSGRVETS
jgi:hypothetical protein